MKTVRPKLKAHFFTTDNGNEPLREWLQGLSKLDKKVIGEDILTVQYGWPIGMPLVDHLRHGLWEIRIKLEGSRIARIIFFMDDDTMILVHGFMKKTWKTPKKELNLARDRKRQYEAHNKTTCEA